MAATTPVRTYSDDDIFARYVGNLANWPTPLEELHAEAARAVERTLKAAGWTHAQLEDMSDDTVADLALPACLFVQHLVWLRKNTADGLDQAERLLGLYDKRMGEIRVTLDEDADGQPDEDEGTAADNRVFLA